MATSNVIQLQITANDLTAPATGSSRKNLESIKTCVGDIGEAFQKMQTIVTSAFLVFEGGGAIGGFVKSLIDAGMQAERLGNKFSAATGSIRIGTAELEYAKQTANRLGLEYVALADSYASFVASSKGSMIEGDGARKIFTSVSEASAALKLSSDETKGALVALSQMMSKGTVQAEELKGQLGERLPGAFRLAAVAMGMTTQELQKNLEAGKIMASDMLPKLADQLHRVYGQAATESANSAQAALNRFNNALTESRTALGQAILPTFTAGLEALKNNLDNIKSTLILLGETAVAVIIGKTVSSINAAIAAHNLEKAAIIEKIALLKLQQTASLGAGPQFNTQIDSLQKQQQALTMGAKAAGAFGSALTMLGGPIGLTIIAAEGLYIAFKKWLDLKNSELDKQNAPDALDKLRKQLDLEKEIYDIQREKMGMAPVYRKDNTAAIKAAETNRYMQEQSANLAAAAQQMAANAAFPDSQEYKAAEYKAQLARNNIKVWNIEQSAINKVKEETAALKKEEQAREDAKKKAAEDEKAYVEDVKNNITDVKNQVEHTKELGKARLEMANDNYKEDLEKQTVLYERGKTAIEALRTPLIEYGKLSKEVFSERFDGYIEAVNKLGDQYETYLSKVTSKGPSKEIRQSGVDILAEMKNQAQNALQMKAEQYRDMLGKAKNYYDDLKKLIKAKEDEIYAFQMALKDQQKSQEEKDRTVLGQTDPSQFNGKYAYLDPNLDALAKRQALIEKLTNDQADALSETDPARQIDQLKKVAEAWRGLDQAVVDTQKSVKTVADFSEPFSSAGFIKEKQETIETNTTLITQAEAMKEARGEEKRINDLILEQMNKQKTKMEDEKNAAQSAMNEWARQVKNLEGLLDQLSRDITINLKVNGMDQLNKIVDVVNASGSFSSASSSSQSPSSSGTPANDYYESGGSYWWGDGAWAGYIEQRATGGPVKPYATYRINENGTEYLTMGDKGGYITPVGQTPPQSQNNSSSPTITLTGGININLPNVTKVTESEADQIARMIFPKIQQYAKRYA